LHMPDFQAIVTLINEKARCKLRRAFSGKK